MATIIIAGLGLLGGSLAACWHGAQHTVIGVARQPATLAMAQSQGIIQQGFTSLAQALQPNAWLVLCGPLSVNAAWLADHATAINALPDLYVTDVGSCKRRIVAQGQALLPGRFMGGHPMAGKAHAGLAHAEATLFTNRHWLLCPTLEAESETPEAVTASVPASAMATLTTLLGQTGAKVQTMDATTHDRMMAWVSHVPQLYSVVLAQGLQQAWPGYQLPAPLLAPLPADQGAASPQLALNLAHGPALSEHLRLSTSPYSMWQDIFEENNDNIHHVWQQLMHSGQQALQHPAAMAHLFANQ
jgi:prephenate dehydrogenase